MTPAHRATGVALLLLLLTGCGERPPADDVPPGAARATFAGGCFWCMEPPYEKLPGVYAVVSGYTGGQVANPTYEQVSGGGTGHYEAVEVLYDPTRIRYEQLLEIFWRNIDPHDRSGQFCDIGLQYRAAIFAHDETQRKLAEASKQHIQSSTKLRVVTEILPASTFFPAERIGCSVVSPKG